MATYSAINELTGALYTILNSDTELKTQTGLDKAGNVRVVGVYRTVVPEAPIPYVRIKGTNTVPLQPETHNLLAVKAKTTFFQVDTFSDNEKECCAIASRLEDLLGHVAISSDHFAGNTWATDTNYFTDNQTTPDRLVYRGSLRVRINYQQTTE